KPGLDRSPDEKDPRRAEGDVVRSARYAFLCRQPVHAGRRCSGLFAWLAGVPFPGDRLADRISEFGQAVCQVVGAAVVQGHGSGLTLAEQKTRNGAAALIPFS